MLEAGRLPSLNARVVAVADPNPDAVGLRLAKKLGIFTTLDYGELATLPEIDLVIELAGNTALLSQLRVGVPSEVRTLETVVSNLLTDVIRFRNEYLLEKRQLDLSEMIVENILASIHDAVAIIRPDFKVLDANEAFSRRVGLGKADIIGSSCHTVINGLEVPCEERGELCPLIETLETGMAAHAIHEHPDRDNHRRYTEVSTVPLRTDGGEIEMVLLIMRDITAELERRFEQKARILKQNLARLIHEDKMIALGKLVSSAVHEINNPLSGILALARLMHQRLHEGGIGEKEADQFRYYLQLIDNEAARCSTIVGNLLSFSRQQKIQHSRFVLEDVVRKVVLLFRHKAQTQRIEVELDLAEDLPDMLGDPGQIQQCIVNLLFNAMESMPQGGKIFIRTGFEPATGRIELEVEDTGTGIPEPLLSQIFEPFFSTKQGEKGVGLGLSVVYGIIEDHHGIIDVRSEEGVGTVFTLSFTVPENGVSGAAS